MAVHRVSVMWPEHGKGREGGTHALGPTTVAETVGCVAKSRCLGVAKAVIAAGGKGGKTVSMVAAFGDL